MQAVLRTSSSVGYTGRTKKNDLRIYIQSKATCKRSSIAMRGLDIPSAQCGTPSDPPPAARSPNIRAADFPWKTKDCLLFYSPETAELAEKIVAEGEGQVELGEIDWRYGS